jgi:hypothetical protein
LKLVSILGTRIRKLNIFRLPSFRKSPGPVGRPRPAPCWPLFFSGWSPSRSWRITGAGDDEGELAMTRWRTAPCRRGAGTGKRWRSLCC